MKYSTKNILAQIASYTIHPGILPTLGALYVLYVLPEVFSYQRIFTLAGTVFLGTYLLPIIAIFALRGLGIIESIHLIKRNDRIYPYLATTACILATSNLCARVGAPREITLSLVAGASVVLASTIALPFYKSSAHMAGISGFIALYIVMGQRYGSGSLEGLVLLVALAAYVAWARITLNRHTLLELLSGLVIGFCSLYLLLSR